MACTRIFEYNRSLTTSVGFCLIFRPKSRFGRVIPKSKKEVVDYRKTTPILTGPINRLENAFLYPRAELPRVCATQPAIDQTPKPDKPIEPANPMCHCQPR
jgi:hypothetical protein